MFKTTPGTMPASSPQGLAPSPDRRAPQPDVEDRRRAAESQRRTNARRGRGRIGRVHPTFPELEKSREEV